MPSHVYLLTGRYGEGVAVNIVAHESDVRWLSHGMLPYGPAHDLIFLIYCACMDGQSDVAEYYGKVVQQVYKDAPGKSSFNSDEQCLKFIRYVREKIVLMGLGLHLLGTGR